MKKIVGSTTTRYISQLYECENTNCSRMIFSGPERVATLVPSGGIHYYHPDHLGSSSVITDGTGATVQNLTYFPYGATRTNSSPVTPAVDVPYKYTGQELDASTDLYNYEARQYEAALGRFVSPDTVVPDPFNPQDLNRYAYVRNSPLNYTDPTGHITCDDLRIRDCLTQWFLDLFGGDRTGTPPTQPPQPPPPDTPPIVPVREVNVTDSRLPPPITIFPSSPPPNTPYWGEFGQRGMGGDGRGGTPTPEETRDVINGLMQDIVGSALMGGIASKNPRNADAVLKHLKGILKPGGKLIGEAGSPGVRVLSGDIKAAEDLTLDLGKLGQIRNHPQVQDGVGIDLPGGGFIGFRPHSSSGGPAIDINVTGFDDFRKIHFK